MRPIYCTRYYRVTYRYGHKPTKLNQPPVSSLIQQHRLKLFGHIARAATVHRDGVNYCNYTLLGGLTLYPAGMHCPSWDDAFVSCFFFCLSRSESGAPCVREVHSSYNHCVAVYCPISTRFSAFFHNGLFFQQHYLFRIFIAIWCHNFREIAVKNCEKSKNRRKSLCAPLRIDS